MSLNYDPQQIRGDSYDRIDAETVFRNSFEPVAW